MAKATFAAGCFWGVEEAFRGLKGVSATAAGYSGGAVEDPAYEDVCSGETGHAEVVRVEYDPARISYEALLEVFWDIHDPTTLNRQGLDIGTQYRSAIFYHDVGQEAAARDAKERQRRSSRHGGREIVTEISPAGPFYRAEDEHQRYLEKRAGGNWLRRLLRG